MIVKGAQHVMSLAAQNLLDAAAAPRFVPVQDAGPLMGPVQATKKLLAAVRDHLFSNRVDRLSDFARTMGVDPNKVPVTVVRHMPNGNKRTMVLTLAQLQAERGVEKTAGEWEIPKPDGTRALGHIRMIVDQARRLARDQTVYAALANRPEPQPAQGDDSSPRPATIKARYDDRRFLESFGLDLGEYDERTQTFRTNLTPEVANAIRQYPDFTVLMNETAAQDKKPTPEPTLGLSPDEPAPPMFGKKPKPRRPDEDFEISPSI